MTKLKTLSQDILLNGIWMTSIKTAKIKNLINISISNNNKNWIVNINKFEYKIKKNNNENETIIKSNKLNGVLKFNYNSKKNEINGYWIQFGIDNGYVSPLYFHEVNNELLSRVRPLNGVLKIFFMFLITEKNYLTVNISNQDRNLGVFYKIKNIEISGNTLNFYSLNDNLTFKGFYEKKNNALIVQFPYNNSIHDLILTNVDPQGVEGYNPRINAELLKFKNSINLIKTPKEMNDGWKIGSLKNINTNKLNSLINQIIKDDFPNIHSLLICVNNQVILDEYFYGYNEEKCHDTRSASKSISSLLIGIAIDKNLIENENQLIYTYFNEYKSIKWDDQKKKISIKHLMTMSSGFDCDDNNSESIGCEDNMQDQVIENDWIKYTLNLPMICEPGTKSTYCTAGVNLLGRIIKNVSGIPNYEFADRYLFRPLGISDFHLNLSPTKEGYFGGGLYLRPRDMAKIGQLILNEGMWKDKQVISTEWIKKSSSDHVMLSGRHYGYNWWLDYPKVNNQIYKIIVAEGNGGQFIFIVPKLNLVTVMTGGNYNRFPVWNKFREFLAKFIIPALLNLP